LYRRLIVATLGLALLLAGVTEASPGGEVRAVTVADLDGDGADEVSVTTALEAYLTIIGAGERESLFFGSSVVGPATTDLDGDGDAELLYVDLDDVLLACDYEEGLEMWELGRVRGPAVSLLARSYAGENLLYVFTAHALYVYSLRPEGVELRAASEFELVVMTTLLDRGGREVLACVDAYGHVRLYDLSEPHGLPRELWVSPRLDLPVMVPYEEGLLVADAAGGLYRVADGLKRLLGPPLPSARALLATEDGVVLGVPGGLLGLEMGGDSYRVKAVRPVEGTVTSLARSGAGLLVGTSEGLTVLERGLATR